jgi:putative ABC transport system substrate-binding protein
MLREELRQRGYVPGQNILYEDRWAEGHFDRLPELAAELVRWNADLIVAGGGTPAALAAKKVTTTVPIVVVGASLPVEMSLVASLARPGGNVTGITFDAGSGETSKRLQLFREVLPRGGPVVGIVNLAFPGMTIYWNEALQVAKQLGMEMDTVDTRSPTADIVGFIGQRRVGGLYVVLDQVVAAQGRRIIEAAIERRWPTMLVGPVGRGFVEAGGLMVYSSSPNELYRKAAVLRGQDPQGCEARRPAYGATHKVRAGD